jgi:hypothetical protein
LTAQNVEKTFPELVFTDKEGVKFVSYANLVAPLVEAVKELKIKNESLEREIDKIRDLLEKKGLDDG